MISSYLLGSHDFTQRSNTRLIINWLSKSKPLVFVTVTVSLWFRALCVTLCHVSCFVFPSPLPVQIFTVILVALCNIHSHHNNNIISYIFSNKIIKKCLKFVVELHVICQH